VIKPCRVAPFVAAYYLAVMPKQDFTHIDTWIFDLDNTLYCPSIRLFDQIQVKMTDYVMQALQVSKAEADQLRDHYWRDHGTTLAGLMHEHDIDPHDFLVEVHDISFDALTPDPELRARISALPGRRIIYTNGSAPYAQRVIEQRGLSGVFDAIYGVEHAGFRPKPEQAAFDAILRRDQSAPDRSAMFEDDVRNLSAPHAMGMRTVHVAPEAIQADHIHHHTDDLSGFLAKLI
jgi:putative hydrolase of the HAD superfamily